MNKQNFTIQFIDQTGAKGNQAAGIISKLQAAGITITSSKPSESDISKASGNLEIVLSDDRLSLADRGFGHDPISVDFSSSTFKYRLRHGGGRKQALAKAVGLKANKKPLIFDATAGLGKDSFILASLGCKVILCEQSALIATLLEDGLERAAKDIDYNEIVTRIKLYHGNSIELLPQIAQLQKPDVVYLDPMFPHRSKSAKVKKDMRILRIVAGVDVDSHLLLQQSKQNAGSRVVCKRPKIAPELDGPPPSHSIYTKKHRFDVYLVK